jgi:cholesterol transport system auxiliary component
MASKQAAVAACAVLVLSACSISRPIPAVTTYIVDLPADSAFQSDPGRSTTLSMGPMHVAAPYADSALVYRLDDVRYVSDPYHAFGAAPGAMLGSRMAAWLEQTGLFSLVTQPRGVRSAPYLLDTTIVELYGDFREGRPPAAVLVMHFAVIEQVGPPHLIYGRTVARRVDLPRASADALVRGYGTAFAEILSQIAPEVSARAGY